MEADDSDPRRRVEARQARVSELVESVKRELDGAESRPDPERLHPERPRDTGATDTSERERDLRLLDDLEAELAELESALRRIDDGALGVEEPQAS